MKQPGQQTVNKGETYQIEITDMTHDGEGVGRVDDFAVFVPEALPGDVVLARVISVKKTYARALIEKILTKSNQRITPVCQKAEWCGGCQLAHMDYKHQLAWKQRYVEEALNRLGKIETKVLPIIGMENPEGYRNKSQFPVGFADSKLVMGFFQKRSHQIVDTDHCRIQHPLINKAFQSVKQVLRDLRVEPYNEINHSGVIRHVVIRVSFCNHALMIVFVTRTDDFPHRDELITCLTKELPEPASVYQNINSKVTNVIFGSESRLLWGERYIVDRIGDLQFAISPRSFFQINPIQTKVLYDLVKGAAALTGTETVWDLYCGIGTIGLYLAADAKQIIGVESVEEAVADARFNAALNGIEHARFIAGKAEDVAPKLLQEGLQPDLVVVDPPRKGCDPDLLATIKAVEVPKVIYVSCNPATLARDLRILTEYGYQVKMVQPVDLFPDTSHVETVVLMSRAKD
ncbi:MAG: 23S rRNA (uracil(1939)-C(5))-methyltransferase RlmD [Firmicutes bacterium]|nr:23S rRNA (uracil(1939)-C(5))-methyltransferase RlmD [Bacillota bacterium]